MAEVHNTSRRHSDPALGGGNVGGVSDDEGDETGFDDDPSGDYAPSR